MPLSAQSVAEVARDQLFPLWKKERERLDRVDRWLRWDPEDPQLPRQATLEMRALVELARTPWLWLVVSTVAQALYVDGYRTPESGDNARAWEAWQRNDYDARQVQIHRAAVGYGYAFSTILPGTRPDGGPGAVMRGVSPRKMQAVYADPVEDDWPVYAIRVEKVGDTFHVRVYDDEDEHFLTTANPGDRWAYVRSRRHGVGVCPVVRYANSLDLDGRTDGEVEPYIPLAKRINKTAFDRLMTQHFSSWKVRTVAGMAEPDTEEDANRKKLQLRQDDLLVAEDPDTKFGTLPETPLDGFIRAFEADVKALAASSQTPTHALTGDLINLNAEALAAARAELDRKIYERQVSFGKSHDQMLRTAAFLEEDTAGAEDFTAHVTWQDTSIRSMSQAVDALGKAAQMLGVPPKALWSRIPGVTKLDVDEWEAMAAEGDGIARLLEQFAAPAAETAPPPPALANGSNG